MDNMHPSDKQRGKRDDFCHHRSDSSRGLGLIYSFITDDPLNRCELPYGQQRYSAEALILVTKISIYPQTCKDLREKLGHLQNPVLKN